MQHARHIASIFLVASMAVSMVGCKSHLNRARALTHKGLQYARRLDRNTQTLGTQYVAIIKREVEKLKIGPDEKKVIISLAIELVDAILQDIRKILKFAESIDKIVRAAGGTIEEKSK